MACFILKFDSAEKRCRLSNICLNKKGFTLIELFLALSVLALVSAVSVSYYNEYIDDAKKVVRKTNEKLVNEALDRYYKEHMTYPQYQWMQDSNEDIDKKINKGLDRDLSGYFVNKKISEIFSEGSNHRGNNVYFRVTEPLKRDSDTGNIDNSFNAGTWKMAKNLRIPHKDFLVHEIRIDESDDAFPVNTFDSGDRFNFPLIPNSVPMDNDSSTYETNPEEDFEIKMVCCPAGTFLMGAPAGETGRKNNENQHTVTLTKAFLISRYEITQKQYFTVMGNNPSNNKASENHPVEKVGRRDALNFCEKLNTEYSRLVPYGYKFDLPTEAQWEYACRAGTTTAFNNGTNCTANNLKDIGWYSGNSGDPPNINRNGHTHPVGELAPNAWGIYDMHGNVDELLKDTRPATYPAYLFQYDVPPAVEIDPIVTVGTQQCHRGGSYSVSYDRCRSASRQGSAMNSAQNYIGFRVVLTKTGD